MVCSLTFKSVVGALFAVFAVLFVVFALKQLSTSGGALSLSLAHLFFL